MCIEMIKHGLVSCCWPPKSIPLESFDVNLVIINDVADVTCVFSYNNASNELVETEFVFPLDSTAAVYHLEAVIDNKSLIALCKERVEVSSDS